MNILEKSVNKILAFLLVMALVLPCVVMNPDVTAKASGAGSYDDPYLVTYGVIYNDKVMTNSTLYIYPDFINTRQ